MESSLTSGHWLRAKHVAQKIGVSESTIWRLTQKGKFPAPVKMSPGCTLWCEREIEAWLASKATPYNAAITPNVSQPASERR